MATHADRAVAPWLQAAGREYPIAFGGLELESSRQRQVQGQPSSRHLQSRAASAGMDDMQGLPLVWIELKRTGEVQGVIPHGARSEEHTSELQSLMRISYAVFCLKKKKQ